MSGDLLVIPIADPHEQRVPCILLLDVSDSMGGKPLQELNEALGIFKQELAADALASKRAEVAIITFGSDAQLTHDFARHDALNIPTLETRGLTAMGRAINMALDELEFRKDLYRSQGTPYTRPWLFLLTDGEPTDTSEFQAASQRAAQAAKDSKALIFGVGVGSANMENLQKVSGDLTFKLNPQFTFAHFFRFVSSSLQAASASRPGETVGVNPGQILLRM